MIFSRLPDSFFTPLASPNKHHYATLLLIYYRLFLQYHHGVERELVIDQFASYFAGLDGVAPSDEFAEEADGESEGAADVRSTAAGFLRRLMAYGWVDEEEQRDFSRLVTMRTHARPFLEALDQVERGAQVEYESHIVAVYSSLTGDSAKAAGEHAVLNAHYHTRMLIESLKILEQNIHAHYKALFETDQSIPEILQRHYDEYIHEVVDRAYTRLKTSDNLSRYRPRIARAIRGYLNDERWIDQTAARLATIQRTETNFARQRIKSMLVEIRDDLSSIDPILESIDDRNRRYSGISTERIRTQLHSDTSLQSRIAGLVTAIAEGGLAGGAGVNLQRLRYVADGSLYTKRTRDVSAEALTRPVADLNDEELAARELQLRAAGQLNPSRVARFLSRHCSRPGDSVWAHELATDLDGYVRVLYAAAYAERGSDSFPYEVEWGGGQVPVGSYVMPEHRFIRRHERD
ncbi:MAG: Wadjet anti-phage system protein JetA family protein [Spirochaetales bacterium]